MPREEKTKIRTTNTIRCFYDAWYLWYSMMLVSYSFWFLCTARGLEAANTRGVEIPSLLAYCQDIVLSQDMQRLLPKLADTCNFVIFCVIFVSSLFNSCVITWIETKPSRLRTFLIGSWTSCLRSGNERNWNTHLKQTRQYITVVNVNELMKFFRGFPFCEFMPHDSLTCLGQGRTREQVLRDVGTGLSRGWRAISQEISWIGAAAPSCQALLFWLELFCLHGIWILTCLVFMDYSWIDGHLWWLNCDVLWFTVVSGCWTALFHGWPAGSWRRPALAPWQRFFRAESARGSSPWWSNWRFSDHPNKKTSKKLYIYI